MSKTSKIARAAQFLLVEMYLDQHFADIEQINCVQDDTEDGAVFVTISDEGAMVRLTQLLGTIHVKASVKMGRDWVGVANYGVANTSLTQMGQEFAIQLFALY